MISEKKVLELIALGNENRNLDYKGAFSWSAATAEEKCEIVKDVLAFANTRDGGVILVGVNDKTGAVEGLSDDQSASFDQTRFNEFAHRFTEPLHTSRVHRLSVEGKRIIAIDVPEFADVPIVCAKEAQSTAAPRKLILRRAGLYKRTDKATSELIEDADEMRELLNRGLLRRQDELMRAMKHILQPQPVGSSHRPEAAYGEELEEANGYFGGIEEGKLIASPHWTLTMLPETYIKDRLRIPRDLHALVQNSAVSLRGWTFPYAGRSEYSRWSNFDRGARSFYVAQVHRTEALIAYYSGLLLWCAGVAEDVWPAFAGRNVLSAIGVIYSSTEWLLFAKRFFESILTAEESIRMRIVLSGAQDRSLIGTDSRISFLWNPQARIDQVKVEETIQMSDLRSDAEGIARRVCTRIFEQFNWNDSSEELINRVQQDFLAGRV